MYALLRRQEGVLSPSPAIRCERGLVSIQEAGISHLVPNNGKELPVFVGVWL
jgi:hypothetical protein